MLLSYSLNVTVSLLLGLTRPVTVAVSLIDWPTEAMAGVWLVLIVSTFTDSAAAPLLTAALFASPLNLATQYSVPTAVVV